MPASDSSSRFHALVERAFAAQDAFIDDRDLDAFLERVAPLLRGAAAASLAVIGEVLWEMDGTATPGPARAAGAGEAEIGPSALHGLLRHHGPTLYAGKAAAISETTAGALGLPPGQLTPVRHAERTLGFFYASPGAREADANAGAILRIVAQTIHLHRAVQGERHALAEQSRAQGRWQSFATMLADALLEATRDGAVETILPLSRHFPDDARRVLLRDGLSALQLAGDADVADVLGQGGSCRDLPAFVVLPGGTMPCRLSLQPADSERLLGALVVDQAGSANAETGLVEMIERIERGRQREQRLRRQAETLLDGLRILTRAETSESTFRDLLSLVREAIHFDQACLVKRNWQGRLAAVGSTDIRLEAVRWRDLEPMLERLGPQPVRLDAEHPLCEKLTAVLDGPCHSILVAPVTLPRETAWLVCVHPLPDAFRTSDVAMARSLALLISQGLSSQDQHNQVVQAAKLAALGQMVAGIAHEINQPLNAIALAAQNLEAMMQRADINPEAAGRKAQRILAQVARVHDITQKMRTFARQSPNSRARFDPVEHIENARSLMDAWLRHRRVSLRLAAPERAVPILGDPTQFEQVVANLLSNATDAILQRRAEQPDTEDEEGVVTVHFSRPDAETLEIAFRDNGTGFERAALSNALVPFFTTKEVGKGTGLGLSISYSIMANMDGGLRLGNWEGGAEVTLIARTAPAAPADTATDRPGHAAK